MQAEVEDLLHRRRVEHRDHRRREHVVGLVRQRRRLGAVVVAGQHQHAAVLRRAGVIGVLEDVAAAVDAGPLAVPHREHAVVARAGIQVGLLRAPDRRRGEVLVQPRLELDVRAVEEGLRLPQRLVEPAQRRAAVAGHEPGGVASGLEVALPLQDQQADQRLGAVQEDATGFERVLVVERDVAQLGNGEGHGVSLRKNRVLGVRGTGVGSARRAARDRVPVAVRRVSVRRDGKGGNLPGGGRGRGAGCRASGHL